MARFSSPRSGHRPNPWLATLAAQNRQNNYIEVNARAAVRANAEAANALGYVIEGEYRPTPIQIIHVATLA